MIFTFFVFSQCFVLAMVIVIELLHKFIPPFARKYGGLSLSVVRDTPEGTRVYHFDIGYEQ